MKIDYLHDSLDRGRQSLVTSWARPLRTPSHTQTMDDLYLAMEDGDIFFVEVNSEAPNLVELMNKAGHLDCAIGSAFAALDYGLERNDLVIAGGEMSSGGIYLLKIEPSSPVSSNLGMEDEPKLGETVANWSPVFDFDLINPSAQGHTQGRAVRDRMYACTGRGEHGAIAEIRYGIQGLIQSAADYMPGIRNIWVLPGSEGTGFFLLCSFPDRSTLCFMSEAGEWEDVSESEFLDMSQTTLAAAVIGEKSVQITPRAINVNLLKEKNLSRNRAQAGDITMLDTGNGGANGDMKELKPMWSRQCASGDLIVAAAIQDAYLVIAVRSGVCIKMTLAIVSLEVDIEVNFLKQIGLHIELQDDPSFVSIIKLDGQFLAVVGTREATIQFYLIDPLNGLIPTLEQSMLRDIETEATMIQRDLFICESSVPVMSVISTQLLCGLRNGTLIMFNATISSGYLQLERKNEIQFGPIPVQVLPHVQREDLALVLAGPELYRFKLTGGEVTVSQIVFEGATIEPALVAVSQVDYFPSPEAYIICATKDQIFMAEIGHSENVCVRRLPLSETPRRLIYYKPLNIFIVAISKAAPMEPVRGSNFESRKRGSSASLCFLNPRT
ncbi:mono-functional DNA-alkylating methyl methanesulfonate N-term-domain-containing protein [Tirmania nivea]|nr:mono-functional DNA-alkylating methyl methanesulfonate N-term-domain-containing protein [Tirmania nivea]